MTQPNRSGASTLNQASGDTRGPTGPGETIPFVKRTQREIIDKGGVAYTVTTWDDETGDAEILEFDDAQALVRRCTWAIWSEDKRHGDVIGEAVWFDPAGN